MVEGTIPLAMHNRLRLLNPLLKESNTFETNPKLYLQEAEMQAASKVAKALKSDASQPLIMMGILGSDTIKTYPAAYMANIIGTICKNTNAKILFNYLPHQEKKPGTYMTNAMPKPENGSRSTFMPLPYGNS